MFDRGKAKDAQALRDVVTSNRRGDRRTVGHLEVARRREERTLEVIWESIGSQRAREGWLDNGRAGRDDLWDGELWETAATGCFPEIGKVGDLEGRFMDRSA
uniref:ANK_REP_REGION domain-containing protein n=1 Tax=Steinernema glaseri TaxID=37863 RepID=A0A1I7ZYU5_9BILA